MENIEKRNQINEAKQACRTTIKERQKDLTSDYMAEASMVICEKVRNLAEYQNAKTVMLYVSVGKEVSTEKLLEFALNDGKEVCLPLCLDIDENGNKIQAEHLMEARLYNSENPLVAGAYGIPAPNPKSQVVPLSEIDLVILPCVACDRNRNRIGHGAGYYDRFIAKLSEKCGKIAICYEKIIQDEIPTEFHDVKMDLVITECKLYK